MTLLLFLLLAPDTVLRQTSERLEPDNKALTKRDYGLVEHWAQFDTVHTKFLLGDIAFEPEVLTRI